ncbi:MAG: cell division protein FtsQ/DivIB [Candidatus Hydrogenedentota bacterium]
MARAKRKQTFRRRKVHSQRRRVAAYLIEIAVCLIVVMGVGLAFYRFVRESEHFLVRTLRIEGMQQLDEERVRAVAGVTSSDNLFTLDIAAVRARVEAIPLVKRCEVIRVFPDVVRIRFTERTPVATVLINSRLFEVDGEGVIVREVDTLAPHEGPFITNVPGLAYAELGDQLEHAALREALRVYEAFRGISVAQEVTVSEIAAMSRDEIRMFCDNLGFEIRWGRTNPMRQAQNLDVFWRAKAGQIECNQYVDLRFDNEVVCR